MIQTGTRIGTIPDAFRIDFESENWFIIELEISNHDNSFHIVPQFDKVLSLAFPLTISRRESSL